MKLPFLQLGYLPVTGYQVPGSSGELRASIISYSHLVARSGKWFCYVKRFSYICNFQSNCKMAYHGAVPVYTHTNRVGECLLAYRLPSSVQSHQMYHQTVLLSAWGKVTGV